MPEVTVVMSVFNGEPYLASALESIVTQSIREFDVLVVNDGSTDRGPAILDAYAARDSRIKVIHQPNAGIAAAANRACALVTSPYIARMDADDVSLHNRLERQLHFLRARPDVVLLGGGAEVIDESGNRLFSIDVPTGNDEIKAVLHERNAFVHSSVVIRRDALLAVGGYRRAFSNVSEDYDLWLRLAERYPVANLADVVVRYRVHRRQTSTAKLEAQTLAALGARVSARFRRAGQHDPFGSVDSVSRETLLRLGISKSEIDGEVARATASWAKVMSRAGYHDTAVTLARKAWHVGPDRIVTRDDIGRFYLAAARASLDRGRVAHSLLAAVLALRWRPSLLGRIVRGGLRRLTGSLPSG